MATPIYIDKIAVPTSSGTATLRIVDTASGYTKNTGTITEVKTSAGAHSTIDVTSGAATFNVPTTAEHVGAVPTSRTVNGKALSSNITLSASDVGALPDSTTIPTVVDTYSSTGTDAVSGKGVAAALGTLDSSIAATTGQAISAITISDGKITGSSKISVGDANQNAFSNVKVGSTTISADTTTDTIELAASGLVTLTPDATGDKVTISASYTETDPTVPSWAKASTKPSYTASEVGAVPTSRKVNGKALSADVSLSAADVGALPDSTVIPQGTVTSIATGTGLTGGPITASGTISLDETYGLTTSDITTGTDTTNKLISAKTLSDTLGGLGGGTITGVTAGTGLSGGGTSGGVTLNHSNSVTAQSTKGIYPIAIDAQGHISDYDAAITPAEGNSTGAAERTAAIPFAKVDSTSTATAFTATVPGITELIDGTCCYLMNGVITSASGWTLNVNGLGAKPVYQTLAAATVTTTIFNVNYTMLFVYNSQRIEGGCWDIFYGYNSNTTYTNASLGQGYGTCATAAATTAKVVTLSSYSLVTGGIVAVKFTYSVPAGATMNINSKGAKAIYFRGSAIGANQIQAGDVAYFIYSTYYHLIGVDRSVMSRPATTVTDVGTGTGVVGTAMNFAREDHKHTISSSTITTALGYTPYNSTNPSGYITGISSTDVTNALGYTPYNSTNPDGYITANDVPKENFIVTVTLTSQTGGTSDKTSDEIAAAASAGKLPVVVTQYYNALLVAPLSWIHISSDPLESSIAYFTYEDQFNDDIPYAMMQIWGSAVTLTFKNAYITPSAIPTAGTTATEVSTTSSGGSATTWSKSDHVHSISSSTITSALGFTPATTNVASSTANGLMSSSDKIKLDGLSPTGQVQADWSVSDSTSAAFIKNKPTDVSDFTNDAGYLTQTTLGAALQANTALTYELVYHEAVWNWDSSQFTPAYYTIADTLANVVANISSDRKVIFRQSLDTGKYNYWQPWFNNPNSSKIGLYRFEKDGGKLYHVVFEPDDQGTGLTGTEVEPYYLNQYDPYAVGKIITTSSISDNPNNYLSGSWTLIDKEFISRNRYDVTSAAVSANTTNTNSVSLVASRMGHDLYLQVTVNNKVAISTTNLELFTLKTSGGDPIGLNALGLSTRIDVSYFHFLGYCDNASAAAMMDIDYSGRVRSLNVLTRGNATSIAAGNVITATFTLHSPAEFMLDSYCDKFYWRRDS